MNAELALDGGFSTVSPAPTWVTSTLLLARRNVLKTLRSPAFVSFSLLQPVVWLVLFSQTFSRLSSTPQFRSLGYASYLMFVIPAMMVLSATSNVANSDRMASIAFVSPSSPRPTSSDPGVMRSRATSAKELPA